MTDPNSATQKAIYTALHDALASFPAAVYDDVPQAAAYPYVVIDAQEVLPQDYLNNRLEHRFFYLSIWSTYPGQKEVLDIMSAIDAALHNKRFPLDTGHMVSCQLTSKRTGRDADGRTYMGNVTAKVITER